MRRLNLKMNEAPLNQPAVRDFINAIRPKYQEAPKPKKSEFLNTAMEFTGLNRKHLIKSLNTDLLTPLINNRSGRPNKFDFEGLRPHIMHLWEEMNQICAKRMKEALKEWLIHYKEIPANLKMQLLSISSATLSRYLNAYRKELLVTKGLSTTSLPKSSIQFKNNVPIRTLDAEIKEVGFVQIDTVSHCGTNAMGPFISSLTLTDILSAWTSNRAMMGKTGAGVVKIFKDIESNELPFLIKEGNGDCGTEFLNKTVIAYAQKRWKLTRSRPYKKNDNCFVEQKNFTHVRQLFGYERLDEEHLVELMNEIYKNYWNPLQNFFLPTLKLKEKIRVGARIKKIHDQAKTPYQRILNAPRLTQETKDQLIMIKSKLNPFELKKGLDLKLKEFNTKLREYKNLKDAA